VTMLVTEPTSSGPDARGRSLATDVAICLSMTAALAHAVAAPAHFGEWLPAGIFFVILAVGQTAVAWLLVRSTLSVRAAVLALWSNVAVVLVYLVSRTRGLPFGLEHDSHGAHAGASVLPHAVESIGGLDLLTLGAEVGLVVLLIGHLPERLGRRTATMLMLTGVALWASAATGVLG
jgi:hypothetical protein